MFSYTVKKNPYWISILKLNILLLTLLIACESVPKKKTIRLGIQDKFKSYIPARVSVFPCFYWAKYKQAILKNKSDFTKENADNFCEDFDKFVLKGFKNQNFMRGYTSNKVKSLLAKNNKSNYIDDIFAFWKANTKDCNNEKCKTTINYYQKKIRQQEKWLSQLNLFSNATDYSDAILLPFIDFADNSIVKKKTTSNVTRKVSVSLILIDNYSGDLIWASTNVGTISLSVPKKDLYKTDFPKWELLKEKVFSDILWKEYPGKVF